MEGMGLRVALHERDALRGYRTAGMDKKNPHERHPETARDDGQHQYIHIARSQLPVRPVQGQQRGAGQVQHPHDQSRGDVSFTSSWRMSMISTNRARNRSSCSGPFGFAFTAHPEIARFRLESYETLQKMANENDQFTHKISALRIVQGELRSILNGLATP